MMKTINKKYLLIGGALVIILFLFLIFRNMNSFGTLTISAPASTPKNAGVNVEVDTSDEKEPETFILKPGESRSMRLRVGNYQVNSSVGSIKSVDIATVAGGDTTNLEVPTGEQRAIKQLATNVDCPVFLAGKVYSYRCGGGEGGIKKHGNTVGYGNMYLYSAKTFFNLAAISDGLLGFNVDTKPDELELFKPQDGTIQTVKVPAAVQSLMKNDQPSIVPQEVAGSNRFLLVFSQSNKVYLFQNTGDQNPTEIKFDKGLKLNDENRKYDFSFGDKRIVMYAGVPTESGEGETEAPTTEQKTDLPIYDSEYDLAGNLIHTREMPKDATGDTLHYLGNNYYTLSHPYGVSFLYFENSTFKTIYTLSDVASRAFYKGNTYVQSGGTIYQFTPGQNGTFGLHSRFASSALVVSELYSTAEGIMFSAFAGRGEQAPLNTYRLLDSKQTGDKPDILEQPQLSGLYDLTNLGITEDQLNNLQAAFAAFAKVKNITYTGVTATAAAQTPRDPNIDNPIETVTFNVNINDTLFYKAKIEYSDLLSIRLYLYNRDSGELVFDSASVQ